jgi:tetratricopeptide (TPR) repeat protein
VSLRGPILFTGLFLGGILALGTGAPARAQSAPAPNVPSPTTSSPGEAPVRPPSDWLAAKWARVVAAPSPGDAAAALEMLEASGLSRGVESLPAPALALISGRGIAAKLPLDERIAWAQRLASHSAAVQFAAAGAAWPLGLGRVLALYAGAFGALPHDFGYLAGLASRLAVILLLGFVLALAVFAAAMFFKYGRGFLHDLAHLLPIDLPRPFAVAAAVALAGVPLVLGLGGLWVAGVWCLAVWGTLSWRERFVAAVLLALLTGAEPLALGIAKLLPAPAAHSPMAEILRVQTGMASEADRVSLAREAKRSGDPIALFALAGAARQAGDVPAAESALRRALAVRPGWASAENNLALLCMDQGRLEEAELLLKRALEREPSDARLQFNLAYLYRKSFRLQEADKAFLAARSSDPGLVERLSRISVPRGAFAIPMPLSQMDLWREHLADTAEVRALAESLAGPFLGRIPLGFTAPTAVSVVVLGVFLSLWLGRRGRAGRCFRCGLDVCPRCFGNEFEGGMCKPCHILYVQNARVETRARMGQDQRVMRQWAVQRRPMLLVSGILPGVAQLLLGETGRGFALLTLACVTTYAPLELAVSGMLHALWNPLGARPLGGLLLVVTCGAVIFAFVFSVRDLKRRLRPA